MNIGIVPGFLSKHLFYPLWDLYDSSIKLKEMRRLQALQREPYERKRERQWELLNQTLAYAREHCRFYRDRIPESLKDWNEILKVPILTKTDVRENLSALSSDQYEPGSLISSKTGGSTGVSLELRFDKICEEKRNAMALCTDQWCGWSPGDAVGALWGNPPVPTTFKERVRHICLDRKVYLDTVHLTEKSMAQFSNELKAMRIHFLFGHAHSLFIYAKFVEAQKIQGLDIRGIISTSMMLLPPERKKIEAVFGCPVTDRYGCEEVGLIASQCERGKSMHVNADHLVVEVLNEDGGQCKPGETGKVVVTDLINRGMPLIRYQVGDLALPAKEPCACGRETLLFEKVTGRTADFLIRKDGGLVAGVSLVERTLTAIPGLEQLQIVQEKRELVKLNIVPDAQYTKDSELRLLSEMKLALGDNIQYAVNRVDRLDQDRNGKYRFAICRVTPA